MNERYSISASDECITIHGYLTIEEAFDFLNFYDKKGFNRVLPGDENSTLCLLKPHDDLCEEKKAPECQSKDDFYEKCYKEEQDKHDKTKKRIKELENMIKKFFFDNPSEKLKKFIKEYDEEFRENVE